MGVIHCASHHHNKLIVGGIIVLPELTFYLQKSRRSFLATDAHLPVNLSASRLIRMGLTAAAPTAAMRRADPKAVSAASFGPAA